MADAQTAEVFIARRPPEHRRGYPAVGLRVVRLLAAEAEDVAERRARCTHVGAQRADIAGKLGRVFEQRLIKLPIQRTFGVVFGQRPQERGAEPGGRSD